MPSQERLLRLEENMPRERVDKCAHTNTHTYETRKNIFAADGIYKELTFSFYTTSYTNSFNMHKDKGTKANCQHFSSKKTR
jgi:hypothetical protein